MNEIEFRVWGCRGGRNAHGSRVGNLTSCYSVRNGEDLYVFDAGRGLVVLADAVLHDPAMRGVSRVHVLVTHAHMDHWEGLKDAGWMWSPRNGLALELLGPPEALATIRMAHQPPAFVPLDVLALGTLGSLAMVELAPGATHAWPGATLRAAALHHYSGIAPDRRYLDTLGYQLTVTGGPSVAYLSDHEPTTATRATEDDLIGSSQLAIVDANYGEIAEHAFGHGSLEYAAQLARDHSSTCVLAAHHGPLRTDDAIETMHRRFAATHPNLQIAVEGARSVWSEATGRFVPA